METREYALLGFYLLLTLLIFFLRLRDLKRLLAKRRFLTFLGLLISAVLLNQVLILSSSRPVLLPTPDAPQKFYVPLLGALPVFAAAAWLNPGAAMLVGLAGGLSRLGMEVGCLNEPFRVALLAFWVGVSLQQDYRGNFPRIIRQPVVAAAVWFCLGVLLRFISAFVQEIDAGLAGVDYAVSLTKVYLGLLLLKVGVGGVLIQALYLVFPSVRPVHAARSVAPYNRSLSRKMLFLFVSLILVMTLTMAISVVVTTIATARSNVVREMTQDAARAADEIPSFIQTGQSLLANCASDRRLYYEGMASSGLKNHLRSSAFFSQIMLFDSDGDLQASYPETSTGDPDLTQQETRLLQRVLKDGVPQTGSVEQSQRKKVVLSFLAPLSLDMSDGHTSGALLGRVSLEVNPMFNRIVAELQGTSGLGEGFIVNSEGSIVAHSDSSRVLSRWDLARNGFFIGEASRGVVYQNLHPEDHTRQLVSYLPVEGYPWAVVIRVPYEVVLARASQAVTPLLLLHIPLISGVVVAISLFARRLTRPLRQLADAADNIAVGDLDRAIHVTGEDEIGRVGKAFEHMRIRLKDLIDNLSLLLSVSRSVSSTLDLSTGISFVLDGALRATGAQTARFILLSSDGDVEDIGMKGKPCQNMETLDRSFAELAMKRTHSLVLEDLSQIGGGEQAPFESAFVLPVRPKDEKALMWIGFQETRTITESQVEVLSMLASRAAMLMENARLFQATEKGRRQLAAILSSTNDAILVTDANNRILLVNPAFERSFGVAAADIVGCEVGHSDLNPLLVEALEQPLAGGAVTEEIPSSNGQTMLANVSAILDDEGTPRGRVVTMQDVTYFKDLGEMKSEFLATVSHDLRSPLMFMHGYASNLSQSDNLSAKQREYVEELLRGIEEIDSLVNNLLNLERIRSGAGVKREPCHLGWILTSAVDSMRSQADAKDIELQMEDAQDEAIVVGDAVLLRQAVTNLIDNAVKYTPRGGSVTVELAVLNGRDERAVIQVDDTGIGLAPEEQARLFEEKGGAERHASSKSSGSGLGLTIVKSIVERHDGRVWGDSEVGRGSTFYISLPLAEEG